jgi:hypothetical protein
MFYRSYFPLWWVKASPFMHISMKIIYILGTGQKPPGQKAPHNEIIMRK